MPDWLAGSEGEAARTRWCINRRARVRYRCESPARGRVFLADSFTTLAAWVLDLSAGGVGLKLTRPLELGTLVHVELDCGEEIGLELTARVVHAREQPPGTWHLGCELIHQLDDAELRTMLLSRKDWREDTGQSAPA